MSINAQALADLEDEGILSDDTSIASTGFSNRNTTVFTNPSSGSVETPLTDDLKKRLLSPTTVYKTISEGVESITDMETIQTGINQNKAISFANAEEVAMTFEHFKSQVSLSEFTRAPSQVNLAFTQRFMTSQLLLRKENIATSFENFLAGPLVDSEDAFQTYKDFYGKALIEQLQSFQPACQKWLDDKKSIPTQIFQTGKEFVNFATTPLTKLSTNIKDTGEHQLFNDACDNLRRFTSDGFHTNNLLDTVKNKGSYDDFTDPDLSAKASLVSRSALDFLQCFADPYLVEFLTSVERDAEKALRDLLALKESAQVSPTEFQQVRDFVVTHGLEIDDSNQKVHYYLELMELIRQLFPSVSVVLDYFTV